MKRIINLLTLIFAINNLNLLAIKLFSTPKEREEVAQAKMFLKLRPALEKAIRNTEASTFYDILWNLNISWQAFDKIDKSDREKYLNLLSKEISKFKNIVKNPRSFKECAKTVAFICAALAPQIFLFLFIKYGNTHFRTNNNISLLLRQFAFMISCAQTSMFAFLTYRNINRVDLKNQLKDLKCMKADLLIYDRLCQIRSF